MAGLIFALIMSVLGLPLMMAAVGGIYAGGGAPKRINRISGYRTKRSMESQKAWDFAQKFIGRVWLISGLIMLPLTAVLALILRKIEVSFAAICLISVGVNALVMIAGICLTEAALKRNFGENGEEKR